MMNLKNKSTNNSKKHMCFSFLKRQNNKRKQRFFCTAAGPAGSVTTYACGVCVTLKTKCFGMTATNEISTFFSFQN